MKAFRSAKEAKEFLVSRIALEAEREGAPLSEIERKMLYFTESGWTLPDMASVSEEFDNAYNQNEYEKKIAGLIRKAAKHDHRESREEYDAWWSAIRFLKKGDHYILVMIGIAGLRPAGDQLRLFGTAFALVSCFLLITFLSIKYQINVSKYLPSRDALFFYEWAVGVFVVTAYLLLRYILGAKRTDDLTSKVIEAAVHVYQRKR
jgi:hypothetical protein